MRRTVAGNDVKTTRLDFATVAAYPPNAPAHTWVELGIDALAPLDAAVPELASFAARRGDAPATNDRVA